MLITYDDPNYYKLIADSKKGMDLMVGHTFYFYGVFNNMFKIDDMVLEVLEDPDDGYRSSMGAVCHYENLRDISPRFNKLPLAKVRLEAIDELRERIDDGCDEADAYTYHSVDGYRLIDVDTNHSWLYFGTENACDCYPYFLFKYRPDTTQKNYIEIEEGYIPYKERYPEDVLRTIGWFNGDRIEFREH